MELVNEYLLTTSYKKLNTVNGSKGLCDSVSLELKKFLTSKGIETTIIEGIGFIPSLHESAHDDWQPFKGKDQQFLAHVVLLVDDIVIDLTGAQFNINHGNRIIYPLSQFKKEWKRITIPKALNK